MFFFPEQSHMTKIFAEGVDAYHTAAQAVDGSSSSYWAADPEDETAIFSANFPAAKLKADGF